MQRLRRATPIALALFLALVIGAFAGDNEGATFTLTSETTLRGVGPGETVSLEISGADLVGVRNLDVTIEVSDAANFDLSAATLSLGTEFSGFLGAEFPAQIETDTPNRARLGAAKPAALGAAVDGAGSFTLSVPTSADFTSGTQATVSVAIISIGPSASERDAFDSAALGLDVEINPPVSDPTLTAASATDVSVDFSSVGSGAAADGSDGEVSFGVSFADATGATSAGQAVTFTVNNAGAETVYVLGEGSVDAGGSLVVNAVTDSDGGASITLDAEGDKFAGSTSASVSASTSAPNSEGASLDLSADFSATWDVPVPAELASFAGEITADDEVFLQWTVTSQTNNLGWEVYRSTDNDVFERVSPLIAGEGTSDVFRTYEFVDGSPPAADVLYYYLRQLDLNGSASRSDVIQISLAPTSVEEQAIPLQSALLQNFPNPFNPETTILFDLSMESIVSLRVYDSTGQVVRTVVDEALPAGSYSRVWDGNNSSGARVGSGVYFYELRAGSFSSMKKMTLIQ